MEETELQSSREQKAPLAGVVLTIVEKGGGGRCSKRLYLDSDGKLRSDGTLCKIASGTAKRVLVPDGPDLLDRIAALVGGCKPSEALVLGDLKLKEDEVEILSTGQLRANGASPGKGLVPKGGGTPMVARSLDSLEFKVGVPGLCLIDLDTKQAPKAVSEMLADKGPEGMLRALCPELAEVGLIVRGSTSSGLTNSANGQTYEAGLGAHVYLVLKDVSDMKRVLNILSERAWLRGWGWHIISTSGVLLERSVVDVSVASPERLVFEGAPQVDAPLVQSARDAVVHLGTVNVFDSRALLPDLTPEQQQDLNVAKAASETQRAGAASKVKADYRENRADVIMRSSPGISRKDALSQVDAFEGGSLGLLDVLVFDKATLGEVRVLDVLLDRDRYDGEYLCAPGEDLSYGRGKAVFRANMNRVYPVVIIYAHGVVATDGKAAHLKIAPDLVEAAAAVKVGVSLEDVVFACRFDEAKVAALKSALGDGTAVKKEDLTANDCAVVKSWRREIFNWELDGLPNGGVVWDDEEAAKQDQARARNRELYQKGGDMAGTEWHATGEARAKTEPPRVKTGVATSVKDMLALPLPKARPFLYGASRLRGTVSLTVGRPGGAKTALTLVEGLSMAADKAFLHDQIFEAGLRVGHMNMDEPQDELQRRAVAMMHHLNLDPSNMGGELFLFGRDSYERPFSLIRIGKGGSAEVDPDGVAFVRSMVENYHLDVLDIDPVGNLLEAGESDNPTVNQLMRALNKIAKDTDCSIHLVHHARKAGSGMAGNDLDADDARGAGAWVGAARYVRTLTRMQPKEATRLGVPEGDRWRYIRIDEGVKANYAPPASARWLRIETYDLANAHGRRPSDKIGVPVVWTVPTASGVSDAVIAQVLTAVRDGYPGKHGGTGYYSVAPNSNGAPSLRCKLEQGFGLSKPAADDLVKRLCGKADGADQTVLIETKDVFCGQANKAAARAILTKEGEARLAEIEAELIVEKDKEAPF